MRLKNNSYFGKYIDTTVKLLSVTVCVYVNVMHKFQISKLLRIVNIMTTIIILWLLTFEKYWTHPCQISVSYSSSIYQCPIQILDS